MKNIEMDLRKDTLILKINLKKEMGKSKSGKTITVATTNGNKPIPGREDIILGINCYKYPEEE